MPAKKLLNQYYDQMVQTLKKVVAFDTTKSTALPNAPFGKNIANCLDYVLELSNQMGFSTYNCDGYAGHVDFVGKGNEVVGVLGHLDVVPAHQEDGWVCPPFSGDIVDGKLFGRGTMDDKGPMIACLYAVKALKDSGFQPNKTIRLIFGCDEESGMTCMEYYFKKVKAPDISFSPDGDFPVINREKGIYQFDIDFGKIDSKILDINAGDRVNVVVGKCQATLDKSVDVSAVSVECQSQQNAHVLTTHGKNAHASQPYQGKNATWEMFSQLQKLFPNDSVLNFVANHMCDFTAKSWGFNLSDQQSGDLTCNIGVVRVVDGNLKMSIDIRFPVSFDVAYIENCLKTTTPYKMSVTHALEPLYVKADSLLVSTLLDVFNTATNSNLDAIAIGGGTYSRTLKNCVAYGPLFPNEQQTIHMPNENIDLKNLKLMADIYMEAIKRLSM